MKSKMKGLGRSHNGTSHRVMIPFTQPDYLARHVSLECVRVCMHTSHPSPHVFLMHGRRGREGNYRFFITAYSLQRTRGRSKPLHAPLPTQLHSGHYVPPHVNRFSYRTYLRAVTKVPSISCLAVKSETSFIWQEHISLRRLASHKQFTVLG